MSKTESLERLTKQLAVTNQRLDRLTLALKTAQEQFVLLERLTGRRQYIDETTGKAVNRETLHKEACAGADYCRQTLEKLKEEQELK